MTTLADLQHWLDSAGGHAFQAVHGSRQAALAALVAQDREMRQAAWSLNADRERDGLRLLGPDEAANAVRPPGGPSVAGQTDQVCRQFRDPSWRVRVGADDTADSPVHWDGRTLAQVNAVRAARGLEPLQP